MSYPHSDIFSKPVQIQEVVNFLDKLEFGPEKSTEKSRALDYKKWVADGDIPAILQRLVQEQDLVLEKGNRVEIESFYAILSTFAKVPLFKDLLQKIIEHLTKNKETKKLERLSTLSHLYNFWTDSSMRYQLLVAILEYAQVSDQTSAVEVLFDGIDTRLKELSLNNQQKRKIYSVLLSHIQNGDWASSYVLDIWVKYYSTFEANEITKEVTQEAKKTVIYFLKDQQKLSLDMLLETAVVKSLKNTTELALLEIVSDKQYNDYVAFYKKNAKAVDALGLNNNDLQNKMRLLTLTSLASSKSVITFDEVTKLLSIPPAEVEMFVVEAITSDFISARIDQVAKTIIVRHADARAFNKAEWVKLDAKIEKWAGNIQNLLKVVQSVKEKREV
eukprot:TRINITY_DN24171_c0_g1_i1.p1 TRINITY_DN24171_c0_g1~~TRINITY_DN24171_c0_g1_i1.p1  ORF type:complete len:388 (-),score=100.35 TRINITY_DN24171_c0_g1_i1:85-1248(-)